MLILAASDHYCAGLLPSHDRQIDAEGILERGVVIQEAQHPG
jgi:hypothetical protein